MSFVGSSGSAPSSAHRFLQAAPRAVAADASWRNRSANAVAHGVAPAKRRAGALRERSDGVGVANLGSTRQWPQHAERRSKIRGTGDGAGPTVKLVEMRQEPC
jgi:hypothetical protein